MGHLELQIYLGEILGASIGRCGFKLMHISYRVDTAFLFVPHCWIWFGLCEFLHGHYLCSSAFSNWSKQSSKVKPCCHCPSPVCLRAWDCISITDDLEISYLLGNIFFNGPMAFILIANLLSTGILQYVSSFLLKWTSLQCSIHSCTWSSVHSWLYF